VAVKFNDVEVGIGYRFSPNTQLKLAYRRDNWDVEVEQQSFFSNGHSVSLQLSHFFDLRSLFLQKQ